MQIVMDKGEEATTAISEHWGSVHVLTVDEEVEGEVLPEVYCWPRWETFGRRSRFGVPCTYVRANL